MLSFPGSPHAPHVSQGVDGRVLIRQNAMGVESTVTVPGRPVETAAGRAAGELALGRLSGQTPVNLTVPAIP